MGKIWLIIKREYLTRVRNRTFIIMTILGPLFIIGAYLSTIFAFISQNEKPHTVCVVDNTVFNLDNHFKQYNIKRPNSNLKFVFYHNDYYEAKNHLVDGTYQSFLYLPENCIAQNKQIKLVYQDRPSNSTKLAIDVEVNKMLEGVMMENYGVAPVYKDSIHRSVSIKMQNVKSTSKEADVDTEALRLVKLGLALIFGFGIYMFILLYGVQVFRGVMEEKTNRIVEVIVSSVKPVQLMLGKIIGIALVGLTQFLILVVFTTIVTSVVTASIAPTMMEQVQNGSMDAKVMIGDADMSKVISYINEINLPLMICVFLFYFIFGYLLYASLFAAVGSAVDTEADSQQFMLPITMPLMIGLIIGLYSMNEPNGTLGTILSLFPFTAPIVMPIRISVWEPDQVKFWQLIFSMIIQVISFFLIVKLAAKIYRTGILMYGKKPTYKELFKWLRYKN